MLTLWFHLASNILSEIPFSLFFFPLGRDLPQFLAHITHLQNHCQYIRRVTEGAHTWPKCSNIPDSPLPSCTLRPFRMIATLPISVMAESEREVGTEMLWHRAILKDLKAFPLKPQNVLKASVHWTPFYPTQIWPSPPCIGHIYTERFLSLIIKSFPLLQMTPLLLAKLKLFSLEKLQACGFFFF